MEKLELKHLAPYLPHGLQILADVNYNFNGVIMDQTVLELRGISGNKIQFFGLGGFYPMHQFKPAFRPLSDLTKEIEVDGEKFVPLHKLMDLFEDFFLDFEDILKDPLNESYCIVEKLHAWHFDTHGLIQKGLAIDINTLNK